MEATRLRLSALWTLLLLHMAYADIVGYVHPGGFSGIAGRVLGREGTQEVLLLFSVLIELPLAMVFLSLVLPRALNRWANTAAATLVLLFIVLGTRTGIPYGFFALAESAWVGVILWHAWRRLPP